MWYGIESYSRVTSDGESVATLSFGILIYWRKVELRHCPNICMAESLMPTMAAVVAAPDSKTMSCIVALL